MWGITETSVAEKMKEQSPSAFNLKVAIKDAHEELDMGVVKKAVKQWRKRVALCSGAAEGWAL